MKNNPIQWCKVFRIWREVKWGEESAHIRVLFLAVGLGFGRIRGYVAAYRTWKAFYLRLWRFMFCLYLPLESPHYRELVVWPRDKYLRGES